MTSKDQKSLHKLGKTKKVCKTWKDQKSLQNVERPKAITTEVNHRIPFYSQNRGLSAIITFHCENNPPHFAPVLVAKK
jgi:hypothetical protein